MNRTKIAVVILLAVTTLSICPGMALPAPAQINCEKVKPFKVVSYLSFENDPVKVNVREPRLSFFPELSRSVAIGPVIQGLREDIKRLIDWAARKVGVSPALVEAVAQAESGGDQSAFSPAGAIGVMQLMPGTAAALGVNPYKTEENILGGAQYLKNQMDRFGGDIPKAVAAYNAGPWAVQKYEGVPPYKETRDFVARVMALTGRRQGN